MTARPLTSARFYTAKIHVKENRIDSVEFMDVKTLLSERWRNPILIQNKILSHTPDPEDIRYNPVKDEIVWSSEGERKPEK